MSKQRRNTRLTPSTPPITPEYRTQQQQPTGGRELELEAKLFQLLMEEKRRADRLRDTLKRVQEEYRAYRRVGKIRHLAKSIRISHNEAPKRGRDAN